MYAQCKGNLHPTIPEVIVTMYLGMQVTPCGVDGYTNAMSTFTTQADQEARLMFLLELTDAVMRSHVLGDVAAASFLRHNVPTHPVVQSAHFSSAHFVADDHN